MEPFAVPRLIADQPGRKLVHESSIESSVGENNVVSGSLCNNDREWKTITVRNCHDLCCIAGTTFADAIAPLLAGTYVPSMKPSTS